jgi:hypothetical protein
VVLAVVVAVLLSKPQLTELLAVLVVLVAAVAAEAGLE